MRSPVLELTFDTGST